MSIRVYKILPILVFIIALYSCSKDPVTNLNKMSFGTGVNTSDSTLIADGYIFSYSPTLDVYWRIYTNNALWETKIKIQIEKYDSSTTYFHTIKTYLNNIDFSGHVAISDFGVDSFNVGLYRITSFRRDDNSFLISKYLTIK